MSALLQPRGAVLDDSVLRPLLPSMVDALLAIENACYEFPWSRGNFVDSIAAGYLAEALIGADGRMRAYFVAMAGADEMHLLNLTVAPAWQRRGIASALLDELVRRARDLHAGQLWLEVRGSNAGARALYERYGFRHVGLRKGYYPAPGGARENALVMALRL